MRGRAPRPAVEAGQFRLCKLTIAGRLARRWRLWYGVGRPIHPIAMKGTSALAMPIDTAAAATAIEMMRATVAMSSATSNARRCSETAVKPMLVIRAVIDAPPVANQFSPRRTLDCLTASLRPDCGGPREVMRQLGG